MGDNEKKLTQFLKKVLLSNSLTGLFSSNEFQIDREFCLFYLYAYFDKFEIRIRKILMIDTSNSFSQGLVSKKKLFIGSTENILNPRKNLIILFDFNNKKYKVYYLFSRVFLLSKKNKRIFQELKLCFCNS